VRRLYRLDGLQLRMRVRRLRARIYFVSAETEHERDIRPTSDTPPVSPPHSVLHRKAAECPRSDVAVSGHLGIEAVNINGVSPTRWVLDEWPGRAYAQTSFRTGTGENFERSNGEKTSATDFDALILTTGGLLPPP
jgi:hypothetical protein